MAAVRELSLSTLDVTGLKPGDFSGLTALEVLDLTNTPLRSLPDSLPSELVSLKRMKLDLALLTELPESVLDPLLDRPGFEWETQAGRCERDEPGAPPAQPSLPLSEVEAALSLESSHGPIEVQAWTQGRYLVGVRTDDDHLDLFVLSRDAAQRLSLRARSQRPILLSGELAEQSSYAFELAPYALSPSEPGFGLRRSRSGGVSYQLTADEQELQVLRVHEDKIEPVLKTVVYSHHEKEPPPPRLLDPAVNDPSDLGWEDETCAVVAVARSKTLGVFNWIKVQSSSTTRKQTAGQELGARPFTEVFRWTGEHYATRGEATPSYFFKGD